MLIRITRHTAQQNDKSFVLANYKTYQFSRCFICPTICLWNSLPNEVVLAAKQNRFIVLAKKYLCDQKPLLILMLIFCCCCVVM